MLRSIKIEELKQKTNEEIIELISMVAEQELSLAAQIEAFDSEILMGVFGLVDDTQTEVQKSILMWGSIALGIFEIPFEIFEVIVEKLGWFGTAYFAEQVWSKHPAVAYFLKLYEKEFYTRNNIAVVFKEQMDSLKLSLHSFLDKLDPTILDDLLERVKSSFDEMGLELE